MTLLCRSLTCSHAHDEPRCKHEPQPGNVNAPKVLGDQRGHCVHDVADGEGACANHRDDADLPQLIGEDAEYRREDHLREGVGGHDEPVETELISHVGVELKTRGFFFSEEISSKVCFKGIM